MFSFETGVSPRGRLEEDLNAATESKMHASFNVVFHSRSVLLSFRDMTTRRTTDRPTSANIAYLALGGPAIKIINYNRSYLLTVHACFIENT